MNSAANANIPRQWQTSFIAALDRAGRSHGLLVHQQGLLASVQLPGQDSCVSVRSLLQLSFGLYWASWTRPDPTGPAHD